MIPFDYPAPSTIRHRHGPLGYKRYESYRPWLRDEFCFRCVYCLAREQWGRITGEFELDHFVPQARDSSLALDYENLVYACRSCNALKGGRVLPDPRVTLMTEAVIVNPDGTIQGLTKDAKRLIRVLGLDSASYNRWRLIWIRNVELAHRQPDHYHRLLRFPDDLPNLGILRPPLGNSRPEGIDLCYHSLRERGEVPETY